MGTATRTKSLLPILLATWLQTLDTSAASVILAPRRANSFSWRAPAVCEATCDQPDLASCLILDQPTTCLCTTAGLQAFAQCAYCCNTQSGGIVQVNGTSTTFAPYMDSLLDSCYDDGYIVLKDTYSSIIEQATVIVSSSATAVVPSATASSSPIPTLPPRPRPSDNPSSDDPTERRTIYNVTGSFADYKASDFSGGLCSLAYFSGSVNEIVCDYYGLTVFPKSTCSGTTCRVTASTPKLFTGIRQFQDPRIPATINCNGSFSAVGAGATGFYACTCGSARMALPENCARNCGIACTASMAQAPDGTQCNVFSSCMSGSRLNPSSSASGKCITPVLVGLGPSGSIIAAADDSSDMIACDGRGQDLSSCDNGYRICSCSGYAMLTNECGFVLDSSDTSPNPSTTRASPATTSTSNAAGRTVSVPRLFTLLLGGIGELSSLARS